MDPKVGEVRAGEVWRLKAFCVRNASKGKVPYYLCLDISTYGGQVGLGERTRRAKGEKG